MYMKDPLVGVVKSFLDKHLQTDKPLLLAYSGGPDSKALLYLLLSYRAKKHFTLHLAHVDHGWREQSRQEAELLQQEAKRLKLPLHLHTLQPHLFEKGNNLEERARDLRFAFFATLYASLGCQALLLAHQAEDRAEVVLKRVCEGAHLSKFSGFCEVGCLNGMRIWRPLISVLKKELLDWLGKRDLSFFTDPTNYSPRFLRGRMRSEIFPFLTKSFGKQIVGNLCHLGNTADAVRAYFFKRLSCYLDQCVTGALGSYLHLPQLEDLELQFLLREWLAKENCVASRQVFDAIASKISQGFTGEFPATNATIHCEPNRIFLLKRSLQNPRIFRSEEKISLTKADFLDKTKQSPWHTLWERGTISGFVPADIQLQLLPWNGLDDPLEVAAIKKIRKKMAIPRFLWNSIPLICCENSVIYDFLTGYLKINKNCKYLNIIDIKLDLLNK